jgi:hypothetical protein
MWKAGNLSGFFHFQMTERNLNHSVTKTLINELRRRKTIHTREAKERA